MFYYTFTDGVYLVIEESSGELIDQFNTYESMKEEYPEIEEF
jgi:hypothetical protein